MLKTNASKQARKRAFMHDNKIGCAFLHRFMHARVHARMNGIKTTHTAIVSTYLHNVS